MIGTKYEPKKYEPIVLPSGKVYGPILWTCLKCGAAVHEQWRHDKWHDDQAIR